MMPPKNSLNYSYLGWEVVVFPLVVGSNLALAKSKDGNSTEAVEQRYPIPVFTHTHKYRERFRAGALV